MSAPASTAQSFCETQRPHHFWVWNLLGLGLAVLAWSGFLCQIVGGQAFGPDPAPDWIVLVFWSLFGVALPLLFVTCHLTTEVCDDHLAVTYFPFLRRQIAYEDIARCKAVTYQPVQHFGGWGIRVNLDGTWLYSVSGNRGVQLVLHSGKHVLIGSQQAPNFARALETRLGVSLLS
jgi:hypothetical protein